MKNVKVAVVQASPILFNKEATLEKACSLIAEAGRNEAELVLFPEAYIPCYPRGLAFGITIGARTDEGRKLWERYWSNSITVPGPETEALGDACREAGVYLAMGTMERDSNYGGGTLFCTMVYIDPDGALIGKHRKLKPTAGERLIWGEGDGSTLTVFNTEFGVVGGLICWENYMPLARAAMYGKGVHLYLAPTADARESWQATIRHIALEGRCFVLGCNQFVTKSMYPKGLIGEDITGFPEIICRGGSVIVSPLGKTIAGPLWDREGVLYSDLDMGEITRSKLDFDVVGHYARPDVFKLVVDERPKPPAEYLSSSN